LAGLRTGQVLLDPCCGSGTIPVEASLLRPNGRVVGADINIHALASARSNVARAGVDASLCRADASEPPFARGTVDRLVTNPPWGRQVSWANASANPFLLWCAAASVLAGDGRAVAITDKPERHLESLARIGFGAVTFGPISLRGSSVSILVADPSHPKLIDPGGMAARELARWCRTETSSRS
jgi:tRNA G10  N-methylase Trm11